MIDVYDLDGWKAAHEQTLLPETFVEITVGTIDNYATTLVQTVTSDVGEATFSNGFATVNNQDRTQVEKMAFLDWNLWTLDGSINIISDLNSYEAAGFVSSDLSDYVYFRRCTIMYAFSASRSNYIPGFTIVWSRQYEDYPTEFTLNVYSGATVIGSWYTSENKSYISYVDLPVSEAYTHVEVVVNTWRYPDRRFRLESLVFGLGFTFDKSDIISYTHEQSADLTSAELPKNSIEFSLDNSDDRWDILNPNSLAKFLYERQPVNVRYGMDLGGQVEWITGGKFYLSEWRVPANGLEAHFVARDVFDFMLNVPFSRNGIPGIVTNSNALVYETAESGFEERNPTASLPLGDEIKVYDKAAYQNMGGVWYQVDAGWIRKCYIECDDLPTLMSVFNDALDLIKNEVTLLWSRADGITTKLNTYHSPYFVNLTTVAEIIQMCANVTNSLLWVDRAGCIQMQESLSELSDYVIPLSRSYAHPEIELMKPLKQVSVVKYSMFSLNEKATETIYPVNTTGDTITVDNPLLVDSEASESVANAMSSWWKYREAVSGEFRADPRLDVFDVVQVETKFGTISPVVITNIKYTYNGSFRGTYSGRRIG